MNITAETPSFRSRVLANEPLLGCFLTWPTAGVAELLAIAGFDFLVLDAEHGFFSIESIEAMVIASDGAGIPAITRVPSCTASEVGRSLDAGAAGILFPRGDGAAAVRGAIQSAKFPPDGKRGLGGVRANLYGTQPLDRFVKDANQRTVMIAQIETAGALAELSEIAAEPGLDVLYVGPNDLTQALGVPGQYGDPRYQDSLRRIAGQAGSSGKTAGIMLGRADQIPGLRDLGYSFFTTSDRTLVLESARAWRAAPGRQT
jgi:2-dehydro-3-deoxyglucarate aldolase/4-hydroxy-2-oxoheptanedioate aldolase